MAPVQDEVAFRRTDFWRGRAAGFDFSAAAVNAANTVYAEYFRAGQLLANPTVVATCDLAGEVPVAVRGESTFEIRRNGVLHGFAGWFSALLAPGVRLTNCPVEPIHTRRACAFLPLGAAVPTTPGDRVTVVVDLIPAQSMASWQVRVADAAGGITARFRHSTLHGLQIAREDLRRVKPDYVPTLDAWGRARRTVVNLCDGHRSTAAIGAELWRAHGDLFDSVEEAAAFAGEVIMAYSL